LPKPYALIVSSTLPEEGKSFVAANTAAIFSRHDYKTLLVDCDLRRPTIARQFGLDNDAGILHWLRSGEAAQMHGNEILDNPDLGIRKLAPSFDVLTTGGSTKSPTEILSSGLFDRLVSAIKTRYEIIIFDTPPIGLFPDATILADFADSSIYVVRQRRVKRTAARHGINLLDRTNARPIGIVLNAVSTNPGSGIDYGGGTYSAYGHYGHYGYGAKTKYQKHYGEKNDEEDKAPSISA
ncbi:MAG: CpsD/CapB family tyrosine-protein kinase, partial [Puniceicoccaceae bacterium]